VHGSAANPNNSMNKCQKDCLILESTEDKGYVDADLQKHGQTIKHMTQTASNLDLAMSLTMPPAHYIGHPNYRLKFLCLVQKQNIIHYCNYYEI
jgi:hypothetical protein